MEGKHKTEGLWNQLSTELWGCIFSHVKIYLDAGEYTFADDAEEREQASLYLLRTVCKKFNSVFEQHPLLYRDLLLGSQFSFDDLPSLTMWVQSHGESVGCELWQSCT